MGYLRLLLLFDLVITAVALSTSNECQQETAILIETIKTLKARVLIQQQLIKSLTTRVSSDLEPKSDPNIIDVKNISYRDCAEIFRAGSSTSGYYPVHPEQSPAPILVYCDMSDGGGWIVIQRRMDGSVSFNRTWNDYKQGFGERESATGEFWLGNDNLHYLTNQGEYNLRINMEDFEGHQSFAEYRNVKVANEQKHYQLSFGTYSGTAGNALAGTYEPGASEWASHQGMMFSTYDKDNDRYSGNCAEEDKGGWWFNKCHCAHLNGVYHRGHYSALTDDGIVWYTWRGWWYSLKTTLMKIRPSDFLPNTTA